MAINYKVSKCKNPSGIEGTDYYSCKASKTGDYTFDDLAEDINNSTPVTHADCLAVLKAMKPFLTKALLSGRTVVLQDIGRFSVSIQSKCFTQTDMQEEDFLPSSKIKGHRILFRPEVKLKSDVKAGITLKRISSEAMK